MANLALDDVRPLVNNIALCAAAVRDLVIRRNDQYQMHRCIASFVRQG